MQCYLSQHTFHRNHDHMIVLSDHNEQFAVKFWFEPRDFDQKPRK